MKLIQSYLLAFVTIVLVPSAKCSQGELAVDFGNRRVEDGQEIALSTFQSGVKPKLMYKTEQSQKLYTVLMLDPDAPSHANPIMADWLHLGLANIKPQALNNGIDLNIDSNNTGFNTFMAYAPPNPPPGSGFHRYQFILLEQPGEKPIKLPKILSRAKFNRKKFIADYQLKEVTETFFKTVNSR